MQTLSNDLSLKLILRTARYNLYIYIKNPLSFLCYLPFFGSSEEDHCPSRGSTNTITVSWTKQPTFIYYLRKRKIYWSKNLHQLTPCHPVIRVKWLEITEFLIFVNNNEPVRQGNAYNLKKRGLKWQVTNNCLRHLKQ